MNTPSRLLCIAVNMAALRADLQVGYKVAPKPNNDHPAWVKQVTADPRNGSDRKFVRDPKVVEYPGVYAAVGMRETTAVPGIGTNGWPWRDAKTLVRLPEHFQYYSVN